MEDSIPALVRFRAVDINECHGSNIVWTTEVRALTHTIHNMHVYVYSM